MPGPSPKLVRRRRNAPALGEWRPPPGSAWRYGPTPAPPSHIGDTARWAWDIWFGAWFASYWTPADVPALRVIVAMYDEAERAPTSAVSRELTAWMNAYGMTPKGQQLRRWLSPEIRPVANVLPDAPAARVGHGRARGAAPGVSRPPAQGSGGR